MPLPRPITATQDTQPDPAGQFRSVLEAAGLLPGEVIPDGQLHRCPTASKPRSKNGWWVLFHDPPAGAYGDWATGLSETWSAGCEPLPPADRARLRAEVQRQRAEREAAAAEQRRTAIQEAQTYLGGLALTNDKNPYLLKKGVKPCPGLLAAGEVLVVPVVGPDGGPISYQQISPDGQKWFCPGAPTKGGYYQIQGDDDGPLLLCEGLATGLSLHQATGRTVQVAFSAVNLEAVARMARKQQHGREIVLAADNDSETEAQTGINPGVEAATKAARAIGGLLAIPPAGDWNDLHQAEGLEAVRAGVDAAKAPEPTEADQSNSLAGPPRDWPFRLTNQGVFKRVEKENKQTGEVEVGWLWVCSPLEIQAETRDAQGQNWGRLVTVQTREGLKNTWAMPMELLAGDGSSYRAELLSLGLELSPGRFARDALHEYISTARPPERARCVDRLGWHGLVFVLPDQTLGSEDGERVLFQVSSPQDNFFRQAGTLSEWQELAKLAVGNSRLGFAISAAFAGPLLYLAGAESGGFHFRGGSSIGKTTALLVAGSVWGGGDINGFCRNWRATSNGLETVAALHCDTLLCLDEISQVDGREAGATAYMLANGHGKSRARRDGSGRPPAQWRVLFLSTGEVSLSDKMREAGGRTMAGQEVRLIDLPADAGAGMGIFEALHNFPTPGALADHLRLAAGRVYGLAARTFLEKITAKIEGLADTLRQAAEEFVAGHCPPDADGQVKRAAGRFGLVAAAGSLATAAGVVPWPSDEAERAAAACFHAWIDHRGGTAAQEIGAGLEAVRRFIQAHGESRFQPWYTESDRPIINRAGFVRSQGGYHEYLFFGDVFRHEVLAGLDSKQVARELLRRGLLAPDGEGRPTQVVKLPGTQKTARLYVISDAVLGEDIRND